MASLRQPEGGRRLLRRVAEEAWRAGLRDRRRRRQGRRSRTPRPARRHRQGAALGGGVQVRGRAGRDGRAGDQRPGRPHGRRDACRRTRAGARRRHDGQARHPPQLRGPGPQGRSGRRRGGDREGRRHHPEGGRSDRGSAGSGLEAVRTARALPGVRRGAVPAGGGGVASLRQRRLPRRRPREDPPLRVPQRDGHRGAGRLARRRAGREWSGCRSGRPLRPDGGEARGSEEDERRPAGRESVGPDRCQSRRVEAPSPQPADLRPGHPLRRRQHRLAARASLRQGRRSSGRYRRGTRGRGRDRGTDRRIGAGLLRLGTEPAAPGSTARAGPSVRGGVGRGGRWRPAARGQGLRPHRLAGRDDPQRSGGPDRGARRQGHRLRQRTNRLSRRRREGRFEAQEGGATGSQRAESGRVRRPAGGARGLTVGAPAFWPATAKGGHKHAAATASSRASPIVGAPANGRRPWRR